MMRNCILGLLLILSVARGFAGEEKGARVADAEIAAQHYMTAFFHGDLRTAASLTQPETLQQIKSVFAQERAVAVAAGKEAEFLAQFGSISSANLDALSPIDFYVAVVSGSRQAQPEGVAAMQAATVTVRGSERTEGGRAVVTLAIMAPVDGSAQPQEARLSLALTDGQWKIIGNAK